MGFEPAMQEKLGPSVSDFLLVLAAAQCSTKPRHPMDPKRFIEIH